MSNVATTLGSKRARQHVRGWPNDPAARVVVPIVEGQVRSFINDHPEMVRVPPGGNYEMLVLSITKRITNDLLCAWNSARLASALDLSLGRGDQSVCGCKNAHATGDAVVRLASPASPPSKGQTE